MHQSHVCMQVGSGPKRTAISTSKPFTMHQRHKRLLKTPYSPPKALAFTILPLENISDNTTNRTVLFPFNTLLKTNPRRKPRLFCSYQRSHIKMSTFEVVQCMFANALLLHY